MARLLVADDDPAQTRIWQLLLEAEHQVATAETLTQAIDQLSSIEPDVLIMDLHLPGLKEGLELIRRAGARDSTSIVVMSGWPRDLETLPEARFVSCVLAKPVRPATLLRAIKELSARAAAG